MSNDFLSNATVSAIFGSLSGGFFALLIAYNERRSARRYEQFNAFEAVLEELECVAALYWRKPGPDFVIESEIKNKIERVDLRMQSLLRHIKKDSVHTTARKCLDELDEEITGDRFETASRKRDSARAYRIKKKCAVFKDFLHGEI